MPDNDVIKKVENTTSSPQQAAYNIAPRVTQEDIYSSGRFPVFYLGQDNEEIYGQNQTTSEKWKNAVVKFGATTSSTFAAGTAGLVNGLYEWADTGKFSSFYDNEFNRGLDEWSSSFENSNPNFYTAQEKNAAWYSPNTWGTANFWSDTIFKNMGFAAGAYLSGAAWSKGVGSLVSRMSKAVSSSGGAATELSAAGSGNLGRTAEAFNSLKTNLDNIASKYLRADNIADFGKNAARAGIATSGEASIEAMHARENYKERLLEEFRANGNEPTAADLEKINSLADEVGSMTFGANVAVLTATNYIQFPKLPGNLWSGQRAAISLREQGLNRIIAEGDDVLTRTYRAARPNKFLSAFKTAGRLFSTTESFEEGAQYVLPASIEDFVEKGRKGEERSVLSSLGEGLSKLQEKEGMISLLSGGISGGIMQTVGSGRSSFRARADRRARTESFVNNLNTATSNSQSFIRSGMESLNRSATLNAQLNQSLIDNDRLEYEDLKTDLNLNYLLPRIQTGRFDLVQDDIQGYLQLAQTEDGWNRLVDAGIATEEMTQQGFIDNMQKLNNLSINTNEQYNSLRDKYGAERNEDGSLKYTPDVLLKMGYGLSKIDDYNNRINQLLLEVPSPTIGMPYYADLIENSVITEEDFEELANRIAALPNLNIEQIEEIKQKAADILELTSRRKYVREQYEQIKNNPNLYKRPDQEPNAVLAAQTEEEQIVTSATLPEDIEEELQQGDYAIVQDMAVAISQGEDLSQDPDFQQYQENYPNLLDFYIAQIRENKVAPKQRFFEENRDKTFSFQGMEGQLQYNPETNTLSLNNLEITNSDINNGLVTTQDTISDTSNYLSQVDERTPIIERARVIETFQNELTQAQERLNEVQERIQSRKDELQNTQDELKVQQWTAEELVARKKGWFPQFTEAINVLTELRNETQTELDTLTEEQTQLQGRIQELQDLIQNPPQTLSSSIDLLESQIGNLESLVLENGDQINTLSDIVTQSQNLIQRLQGIIRDKIATFQRNNPNAVLETAIRALDQNSPDVVRILNEVAQIENFQIAPAQVRENQTIGQIQDLYKQIEEYERQIQAKQALLNRLRDTQGEVQTRAEIEENVTEQDVVTENVIPESEPVVVEIDTNTSYEGAQKTDDQVYNSTILLATREERQNTPWYVKWEGFTQKYFSLPKDLRQNLRMVFVTANNEESLGLSGLVNYMYKDKNGKPFFKTQEEATNAKNGAIAVVLTELDPSTNDYYFVDQLGNRLGKVGEATNIESVISNKMPSSSTTYASNNQQRAVEKSGIPLSERAAAWEATRESIINPTNTQTTNSATPGLESFNIGILGDAGKIAGARRTAELLAKGEEVTFTKELSAQAARDNELYNTEEIEGGVRVIGAFNTDTNSWVGVAPSSTVRYSKFTISKGALTTERGVEKTPQPIVGNLINEDQVNDKSLIQVATSDNNFKITSNGRQYTQKKGTAWITVNDQIEQAIPRNLNETEVNKVYDLLKLLKTGNQEQNTDIVNYLRGLFYFNTTDNLGVLTLGDESFTLLEGNYLETYETQLKNALLNTPTSVNNDLVKENESFKEILEIKDGTPIFAHWQSYQGFLLNPTYNTVDNIEGERQPTINTMTNSGSYIDRYAILQDINTESNNREETGDTILQSDNLPNLNICI